MALAFLIAFQAAASAPAADPVDFDLAELARRQRWEATAGCAPQVGPEVVVCGRRRPGGSYPLAEWERVFAAKPLVAEIGIGGGAKARAFTESATLGNGMISNRVMVGVKFPF